MRWAGWIAGAAVLLLSRVEASAQCAMCRTAFDSPEGRVLLEAFQSGILFLLAVPYVTFGLVALLAYRARRRLGLQASPDEVGAAGPIR